MQDATSGLATRDDLQAALRRAKDQFRTDIYRAIAVQTVIFTAIVAALTKL